MYGPISLAFIQSPMWIGFYYNDYGCDGPADCSDDYAYHVDPGDDYGYQDDNRYNFQGDAWLDVSMSFGYGLSCATMAGAYGQPPNQHQNEIESQNCYDAVAPFLCSTACNGKLMLPALVIY